MDAAIEIFALFVSAAALCAALLSLKKTVFHKETTVVKAEQMCERARVAAADACLLLEKKIRSDSNEVKNGDRRTSEDDRHEETLPADELLP